MSTGFLHQTEKSLLSLSRADPQYPAALRAFLGQTAPAVVAALGDPALFDSHPLALFCSAACPGSLIVQATDLAHALADRGAAVIGGFHTPVERACLEILLAGDGPLVDEIAPGVKKGFPIG